jgi:hypothetical protein
MKRHGGPADEYDAYINGIYVLLLNKSSDQDIARHLLKIVREKMGYEDAQLEEMISTIVELKKIGVQ